jgi:hypothetical protein
LNYFFRKRPDFLGPLFIYISLIGKTETAAGFSGKCVLLQDDKTMRLGIEDLKLEINKLVLRSIAKQENVQQHNGAESGHICITIFFFKQLVKR